MRLRGVRAQAALSCGYMLCRNDLCLPACGSRCNRPATWGATLGLGRVGPAPLLYGCLTLVSLGMIFIPDCALARSQKSVAEEIEWTWEARPQHADSRLPNVLLVGDSITRNYFPRVTSDLAGIANVYLMASSTSVGDPRLPRQIAEFATTQQVSFAVVHFNNGLHGWGYTELQFETGFPVLLRALSILPGHAKLIWATITPVKPEATTGATTRRIDARNAIARYFVERKGIPVDDQHGLMMRHLDLYEDSIHFNKTGADIMGDQAAATIKQALQSPGR